MSERPFMQLYVSDYLGDTRHLSCEQHGAYLLLLMTMWNAAGSLPDDDAKLARIVCLSVKKWRSIRDDIMRFFSIEGGQITHGRLAKELQKSESKSHSRASAGAEGGRVKALKDKEARLANASVLPQHLPDTITIQRDAVASLKRERDSQFAEWWEIYPRKVSKPDARKQFDKALKDVDFPTLLAGVNRYAAERTGEDPKYTMHPDKWLRGQHWLDEPTPKHIATATGPPLETVGSLSRKQLFTPRNEIDVTDYSSGRVDVGGRGRLEEGAGASRTFAITGDVLGRI